MNGNLNEQKASQMLMSLICEYGLNKLLTSVINPHQLNDADISHDYALRDNESKRLEALEGDVLKDYEHSFGLWPFNEFVPVAVDPEGYPRYYLTGLFINHFSGPLDPVKRIKISSRRSVKLEIKQLQEELEVSAEN